MRTLLSLIILADHISNGSRGIEGESKSDESGNLLKMMYYTFTNIECVLIFTTTGALCKTLYDDDLCILLNIILKVDNILEFNYSKNKHDYQFLLQLASSNIFIERCNMFR
ncbi:hypothetical protein RCL_jg10249.t1 [Rhizophagus clarus]|uniref:Uncharacterized protein n=1 Tax=Rhizophagus clarus TaxID=94130 RepID=A0A8H3QCG5_9GLOM|nr:hypothetical protein RCL_jg10249.t1 [Rhizophagus clarus]